MSDPAIASHADMFVALWRRAEAAGVFVTYRADGFAPEPGMAGVFFTNPWGKKADSPQIWLFRPSVPADQSAPDVSGDVLGELLTLAHEYGHFVSWQKRKATTWPAYLAAVKRREAGEPLSDEDRAYILAEEKSAWRLARGMLVPLGFKEWSEFDRAKRDGLANHVARMGGQP